MKCLWWSQSLLKLSQQLKLRPSRLRARITRSLLTLKLLPRLPVSRKKRESLLRLRQLVLLRRRESPKRPLPPL